MHCAWRGRGPEHPVEKLGPEPRRRRDSRSRSAVGRGAAATAAVSASPGPLLSRPRRRRGPLLSRPRRHAGPGVAATAATRTTGDADVSTVEVRAQAARYERTDAGAIVFADEGALAATVAVFATELTRELGAAARALARYVDDLEAELAAADEGAVLLRSQLVDAARAAERKSGGFALPLGLSTRHPRRRRDSAHRELLFPPSDYPRGTRGAPREDATSRPPPQKSSKTGLAELPSTQERDAEARTSVADAEATRAREARELAAAAEAERRRAEAELAAAELRADESAAALAARGRVDIGFAMPPGPAIATCLKRVAPAFQWCKNQPE